MSWKEIVRAAVEQAALSVLADRHTDPATKRDARAALERDARAFDYSRLSEEELAAYRCLQRRLLGEAPETTLGMRIVARSEAEYREPCPRCSRMTAAEVREVDAWLDSTEREKGLEDNGEEDTDTDDHDCTQENRAEEVEDLAPSETRAIPGPRVL